MNPSFSLYLDFVRFAAAVLVYLWHSNQRFISEATIPASGYGHSAVIVFFVLSGFVIAYVTDKKESNAAEYVASRVSRVYSVALPTVLLTVLLDWCGRSLYPDIYLYPFDQFFLRIAGSLLMLNEVWLISITSFSNVPYWSICYEWWYYVAFGLVTFLPTRLGVPLAVLLLLLLGPKIILLAPVWYAGVVLYRSKWLASLSRSSSVILVAASLAGILAFHHFEIMYVSEAWTAALVGDALTHELAFSKRAFGDYILAALVFMNFAGMRVLLGQLGKPRASFARPIQFCAGFTFTLYLLHQPFMLFWVAVVRGSPASPWFWWTVTALTTLSIFCVGMATEQRRAGLRRYLLARLETIGLKRPEPARGPSGQHPR
jgi:peptidoglycan/LPS O-acetylase OafA/YrhL